MFEAMPLKKHHGKLVNKLRDAAAILLFSLCMAQGAALADLPGSQVELLPTVAEPGSRGWDTSVSTLRRVKIGEVKYNIIVGVHDDVAKGWPDYQTADMFNDNIIDALKLIEKTPSGKKLLEKFKPESKFYLQIFDYASEPLYGQEVISGTNTSHGYTTRTDETVDLARRSEFSIHSIRGDGASSNIAIRKAPVFQFNPSVVSSIDPDKTPLLRYLTEELVHAHRAAHGISPPDLGSGGLEIVARNTSFGVLGKDSLTVRQMIEELEVSADFPSVDGVVGTGPDFISSYKPILDELSGRDPALRFEALRVGTSGYFGATAEEWLDGVKFTKRLGFGLDDSLKANPTESLEGLRQLEIWAKEIAQFTAGKAGKAKLHAVANRLVKKVARAQKLLNRLCKP